MSVMSPLGILSLTVANAHMHRRSPPLRKSKFRGEWTWLTLIRLIVGRNARNSNGVGLDLIRLRSYPCFIRFANRVYILFGGFGSC